jgi:hypothetical protein
MSASILSFCVSAVLTLLAGWLTRVIGTPRSARAPAGSA